jgi:hypothetical protein
MSSDSKLFLEGGRTASGGSRVRPIPCTVCHGRRELTVPPRCNHNGSHWIGRLVRFRLSEIDAWIASGAAAGTSAADQGPQEDVA